MRNQQMVKLYEGFAGFEEKCAGTYLTSTLSWGLQ